MAAIVSRFLANPFRLISPPRLLGASVIFVNTTSSAGGAFSDSQRSCSSQRMSSASHSSMPEALPSVSLTLPSCFSCAQFARQPADVALERSFL